MFFFIKRDKKMKNPWIKHYNNRKLVIYLECHENTNIIMSLMSQDDRMNLKGKVNHVPSFSNNDVKGKS